MYKYFINNVLLFICFIFSVFAQGQYFEEKTDVSGLRSSGKNYAIALGDVNGDGLDDIYVSRRLAPNLLFINKGNFEFREEASNFGLDYSGNTQAAIWIDIENDKDLDLFVINNAEYNILYRNDLGTFRNVSAEMGLSKAGFVKSVNTVDYNNDGYEDIYISYFLAQNVLYKNVDGKYFEDATLSSGINDPGPSMGAVFFDYDNDGDQDLYQTHDGNKANILYRNNGNGSFSDVSVQSKSNFEGLGMGVDAADVNNDGFLDLYITNLGANALLLNKKDGTFENVANHVDVGDIGMGWGTFFFDFNNDGNQDIYVANESNFGVNGISDLNNVLYINNGNMIFEHGEYKDGIQNIFSSYGAAYADFDLDGKLDIVVANADDAGNQIFRNTTETKNYCAIKLIGKKSNYQAIGSRVAIFKDNNKYIQEVKSGSGWISQMSRNLHFGLDDDNSIDSAIVYWPSGIKQKLTDIKVNSLNTIIEPSEFTGGPLIWTEPAFPTQFDDVTVYFNAKEGNGGLAGFDGNVYAHTGVITNLSNSPSDWKHVQGVWGTDYTRTKMKNEGEDIYSLSYNIKEFYGIGDGEVVEKLAFVFRNVNGSVTGREVGGGDIFIDIYPPVDGLFAIISSPKEEGEFVNENDTLDIIVSTNQPAKLDLYDNSELIFSDSILELNYKYIASGFGVHTFDFILSLDGDTLIGQREIYIIDNNFENLDVPENVVNGLNYYSDSTLIFKLFAPNKQHVFFLSYANNFRPSSEYRMRQSTDGSYFWIELPKDIFSNGRNAYIYLIDLDLIADPYSTVVLDPNNDRWLPASAISELPVYPEDRLPGMQITVFDVDKADFAWSDQEYIKPDKSNLVVYETLMRDFLSDRSFRSLKDTLDYFQKLGVNAIELMPVNEFEGNGSWGYNPAFHMALDKEYGSKEEFKAFIDEAHNRGISVILDVVYNHVFSQSPLARMYWDDTNFRPNSENPWLNVTPKHPFNVGYDVNHESQASKEWVKQTLQYWIEEFHVDGFRFDLSKGFTQKNSGGDDVFRQYDVGRIATLKDYADFVWSVDEDCYVILEHFAANDEETELSNYGMMLWGNITHEFGEAARGVSSDLGWVDYTERGWDNPNLVGYMESHDEERMMYKLLQTGTSSGDYNIKDLDIALKRVAAASAIFYMVPGPKMLWQFGELGYDYSINWCTNGTVNGCRLDAKPVRWDYLEDENRNKLNEILANIIHLKIHYPTFSAQDFNFNDGNFFLKTIHFNHEEMDAVVMANFRTINSDVNPKFQNEGVWYEYFTGDSLIVEDTQKKLTHLPGEYRIYTSKRITPPNGFVTSTQNFEFVDANLYPNPVDDQRAIYLVDENLSKVLDVDIFDNLGRKITSTFNQFGEELIVKLPLQMESGIYFLNVRTIKGIINKKFVKE